MRVIHISRRRMVLLSLALGLVIGSALMLAGCFGGDKTPEIITAATAEERVAYLEGFGWQVNSQPIETLDLQLPERLENEWETYAKLQKGQNLPFSDFAGQAVKRYTYTVTNYPERPTGVQANLYLCEGRPVAGDICCPGADGFQEALIRPAED